MKHLISTTLLLLTMLLPAHVSAHDFEVDDIYYKINGNEAIVTFRGTTASDYSNEYSGNVSIPATVSYDGTTYSVTAIGASAFYYCGGLKSIIIPSSVTSIGDKAFYYCGGLSSITIPSNVASIGKAAFGFCSGLNNVYTYILNTSQVSMGTDVFYRNPQNYTSRVLHVIEGSLTAYQADSTWSQYFGSIVEMESPDLPKIVFADAIVKDLCVQNWDTNGDRELSENEAAKVESLGKVFCDNDHIISFNELQYFTGLLSINEDAFGGCTSMISITIPQNVTRIESFAFYRCIGLASITIPSNVTYIGGMAFYKCTSLTSITIPSSVTTIGSYPYGAFEYCTRLASITVSAENPVYDSRENCNAIIKKSNNELIVGCKNTVIPSSVTSIGDYAFSGRSGLTSITIPSSVTSIGEYAFSSCTGLTAITIPSSVTSIDRFCFWSCTGLNSVMIPSNVTFIGYSAFSRCSGLASITVSAENPVYDSRENCNAIIKKSNNELIVGCKNSIIPSSVTSIGGRAFSYCTGLNSIMIPSSVTSIGSYAFEYCTRLASITVSAENPVYDSRENCNAIIKKSNNELIVGCKNSIIPSSVTSIGSIAFEGCTGLTSITIPSSVTTIAYFAFEGCTGLTSITCLATTPPTIDSYTFDSSIFNRATLYVPAGSISNYQNTDYWKNFISIQEVSVLVTSITLNKVSAELTEGNTLQLTATVLPDNASNKSVLWTTSNSSVATVSSNGLVTAITPGTATITATTTDGSNLSASCIVTVYTEMMGDVDSNGSVNISDVTALVDYLLNGDASAIVLSNADCDGNGNVNISDVTELIDYLLSGSWPVEPEPEPVITSYTANGVTFNMVEVEGGTFMMGATPEQGDEAWDKEKPVHQVTLSGYHIGQTEVTQELWQAVMGENPSHHTGDLQRPVDQVSWVDCIAFISKLNQLTGKSFRLPTEAEWEYAARGGNRSEGYRYAGGNDMDVVSWYIGNSGNTTHPVGTKVPNELGLYDMTGNVWEWCNDWYHRYTAEAQVDPTGQATGNNRSLRGGCWNGDANYNRISFRDNFTPTGSNSSGGLRLVLDMDNSPKFRLSETVMKVDMGGNKSVNILNGGGSYTVSGGADFVTASISGNQLTVTGNATGTTTVHVTDAATGAMAVIAVIVTENHDEVFTVNGVTFKMVTVDEGIFTMGATAEQGSDYNSNERPTHQVALSGYKIGQTEVTQELWVAVMGSNPSNFTGNLQRPVDKVSYNDCQEFISKLNQLTGKSFRLPTEAEWEFAARGGNLSQGYKYAGSNTVDDVAWYLDNSESTTHPVGTKAPNELDLYDMSGNVFEWCQDWYGAYSAETQVNPTGPTSGTYRVCRGGAWNYNSSYSRVSYRSYHSMTSQYNRIGLRLALDSDDTVTPSEDEEYVDLGLPSGILWATKNIGAMSPEDYGDYFEISNEWISDCWANRPEGLQETYGNNWPSKKELEELVNECTWTWTTRNSVNGYKVTGPNGKSIFLPAAGYYYYEDLDTLTGVGSACEYWSGTIGYVPMGGSFGYMYCIRGYELSIDICFNRKPVRQVRRN